MVVNINDKKLDEIKGNKCSEGIKYAQDEILNPRRMLTTSVTVENGEWPLVSVKTSQTVSKKKLFPIIQEIKKVTVKAPIQSGQIIIRNVAKTGIDIIATKSIIAK